MTDGKHQGARMYGEPVVCSIKFKSKLHFPFEIAIMATSCEQMVFNACVRIEVLS